MKNFINLLFIWLLLPGCQTGKKQQIIVQGYLIDERTGVSFNPFSSATVRLVSVNNNSNYNSTTLGSTVVNGDGSYQILINSNTTYNNVWIYLLVDETGKNNIYTKIDFSSRINHDFIITCHTLLNVIYSNQSGTIIDSVVVNVSNSKGYKQYVNPHNIILQGAEKNYLQSFLFVNNSIFTQQNDTIYSGCRTTVNDTIKY